MPKLPNVEVAVLSDVAGANNRIHPPVVVVVAGEVDIATSPKLVRKLQALMNAGEVQMVVDVADVEFIDASGIGALVDAARRAREEGGGLELSSPSRMVRRVLDILQLDGALPVVGNNEATAGKVGGKSE